MNARQQIADATLRKADENAEKPGKAGTARLYLSVARIDEFHHGFTYFWVLNPHTQAGLHAYLEQHTDIFYRDAEKTPPTIVCLRRDVPSREIREETFRRLASPQFSGVVDTIIKPPRAQ